MPATSRLAALAATSTAALTSACGSMPHEEGDWREEPHHISALLWATIDSEEEAATFGVDYEYRTSEFLGLGALVEYAGEELEATTLIAAADLHVTPHFVVQAGPGIEWTSEETDMVFRVGVLYEWLFEGGWTISPQVHYDFSTGEDAVITGLAIGRGF